MFYTLNFYVLHLSFLFSRYILDFYVLHLRFYVLHSSMKTVKTFAPERTSGIAVTLVFILCMRYRTIYWRIQGIENRCKLLLHTLEEACWKIEEYFFQLISTLFRVVKGGVVGTCKFVHKISWFRLEIRSPKSSAGPWPVRTYFFLV
jgi:hypothetical protein